MTYATPPIETNWSTSACTVDASRLRMRSTPDDARLLAMAVPFDVNSSVIRSRIVRTDTYQVMAASGISTAARNTMIFGNRPNRMRALIMIAPLDLDGCRPVGDRDPSVPFDACEVDGVEALVPLGPERQRRADSEIEIAQGLQRLPERRARGLRARTAQRLHHDLGVHEPLEADEAHPLDGVLRVAQRLRDGRIVTLHQHAVLGDRGQRRVVVGRYHLRLHERPREVA